MKAEVLSFLEELGCWKHHETCKRRSRAGNAGEYAVISIACGPRQGHKQDGSKGLPGLVSLASPGLEEEGRPLTGSRTRDGL